MFSLWRVYWFYFQIIYSDYPIEYDGIDNLMNFFYLNPGIETENGPIFPNQKI